MTIIFNTWFSDMCSFKLISMLDNQLLVVWINNEIYRVCFFLILEGIVLVLISEIFYSLIIDDRERRILVFFIYFELIHLLLAVLLLGGALLDTGSRDIFITTALLIIGASGAETALFLALFIRFFKLTGSITFLDLRKLKNKKLNFRK